MSGLLDNKKRIVDTIVTTEGRRQLARGKLNIRYVTFTDQDAFYEADAVSGSTDASQRPHLEVFSRPQDGITFESDDVGALMQFRGSDYAVLGGHVLIASSTSYLQFPAESDRRAAQFALLSSSVSNFQQLYSIGSDYPLDDEKSFKLATNAIRFEITKNLFIEQGIDTLNIEDAESLFQDRRLSHAVNFRYLPPVNKSTPASPTRSKLGNYPRLDQGEILTAEELQRSIAHRYSKTINFSSTSRESNIFGQLFDIRNNKLLKLDIIDFGEFVTATGENQHVYFAGRIFTDANGNDSYVNIFTLIFS